MSDRTQELPYSSLVGKEVGGVFIEAVLSRTERSLVLLGTQVAVDRPAVVKVFPKACNDTDADERLLAEAGALSRLRHANVVTLYSVGVYNDDFPYILMEYVPGETLKAMLNRDGAFLPVRSLGIVLQIVNAIEEMHRLGLRHGNLGIHSVRIEELKGSSQDLVKLVGFGLAGGVADEDDRVWYMTPEECTGGKYTNKSDIYVCGVILYQLLTGHMPYRSESLEGLWDEIVSDSPPPLVHLSPALRVVPSVQRLLDRMLSKNPQARPIDARSLRLLISKILGELQEQREGKDKARGFPVIHTVERMIPIPDELLQKASVAEHVQDGSCAPEEGGHASDVIVQSPVEGAVSLEAETGEQAIYERSHVDSSAVTDVYQGPAPGTEEPGRGQVSSDTLVSVPGDLDPKVFTTDIEAMQWQISDEIRYRASSDKRYALLVVHRPSGPVPEELSKGLNVLMSAAPQDNLIVLAVLPPKKAESWLPWLAARARQFRMVIGLSVGRRFQPQVPAPASYTVRMGLQAARRAPITQIVAGRHAVDGLGLSSLFVEFDERRPGRYSSFLRYVGLAGS